jgi:hypothetical protein
MQEGYVQETNLRQRTPRSWSSKFDGFGKPFHRNAVGRNGQDAGESGDWNEVQVLERNQPNIVVVLQAVKGTHLRSNNACSN